MKKLRIAMVGYGKVAHLHANILAALEEAEFVAVCAAAPKRAETFAAEYNVELFSDVTQMVSSLNVDVVIICTPHPQHAAPTVAAAKAGANVLVEKPLASSLTDCDAMITAARESGIKLGTIFQRRWFPGSQRVRQAIDQGKIGIPVLGTVLMLGWRDKEYYDSDRWRGTWSGEGGGVLVNQACHQIDLLQWFMGPIDELYGCWENFNHPYIKVEDTAIAIVRFKNGALGNILTSNSQKPGIYGKVHVHGKNGASVGVQTDDGAMFIAGESNDLKPPVNDLWTVPGEEQMLEQWKHEDTEAFNSINPMEHYHRVQIQDFLQAIIDNREPAVTGEDGRKTVEIFTGIYRSQKTGKPVKFPLKPEPQDNRH